MVILTTSATVHTECLCPQDSQAQALAKIANNLSSLFYIMSYGLFRGQTVNMGACLCTPMQILAAINNNVSGFFTWYANSGGAPFNYSITTWAELAQLPTVNVTVGAIQLWVDSVDGVLKATQLLAGTDATDTAQGVQRPDDYSAGNQKVWYSKLQ